MVVVELWRVGTYGTGTVVDGRMGIVDVDGLKGINRIWVVGTGRSR